MIKNVIFIFLIVCGNQLFAQTIESALISKQIDSIQASYTQDLDGAEAQLKELLLALKGVKDPVLFKGYALLGIIKKYQSNYEESINYHKKAIAGRRFLNENESLAISYIDMASTYMRMADFEMAFEYLDSCLVLARKTNNAEAIVKGRLMLGNLWQYEVGNQEKALVNYRSGLRKLKEYADLQMKAALYTGIANVYSYIDARDSVMYYYRLSRLAYEKTDHLFGVFITYENMGVFMLDNSILDSAEYYLLRAKKINESLDLVDENAILAINLNQLYTAKDERKKGFEILSEQLKFADELSLNYIEDIYSGISTYFENVEQYDSALIYFKWYNYYKDSTNRTQKFLQIKKLEAKYDNERLRAQKLEAIGIKEKTESENRILMLTLAILASLVVLSGFGVLLLRQKLQTKTLLAEKNEVIHQQKLNDLMREKQIERMTALMEGQEKERTRVARELHDSIGTLLATLKHHFQLIETQIGKNDEKYQRAHTLLDKASAEVRRISHNIASNVLSKFGLVAALQDLAEEITSAEKTEVKVFATGLEERLDNSVEIHLFRVVQELVSNALKHAKATVITIQFTMHDNELNLMVEDNGVGFDARKVELSDGMGMENLKARIKHLKGEIDIDSNPGKGTTVIVNVPIAKA